MKYKAIVYIVIGLLVGTSIGFISGMGMQAQRYAQETIVGGNSNSMNHTMPDGTIMSNNHTTDMASMMHDMNKNLEGKTGDAFDQAFLSEMIVHHQGAVDMAEQVLKVSKRPELIKLANDIISAQNKEIEMMQNWQSAWKN
jgi:uncharacterized protein (DUF305 family)